MGPIARRLVAEDAERYVALRREMLVDSPWAFGSSPGQDRGSDIEGVRASLGGAEYAIVGAFEDDVLVAAAGVRRDPGLKERHRASVWGVYVTPRARGRGLGRAVVAGAIEAARGWAGVERVQLSVSEKSVAARRMYESLGFEAWGVEPDCLRLGGEGQGIAEVHMTLWLGV